MDTLQTVAGILDSMGPALLSTIVVLVALILIWLIVRASRRKSSDNKAEHHAGRRRYEAPEPSRHPKVQHSKPTTPASQPEAATKPAVVSSPMAENLANPTPVSAVAVPAEPEDSVLHRHYEAEMAARKALLTDPYPTDSVLRRHYDASHRVQLNGVPQTGIAESGPAVAATRQSAQEAEIAKNADFRVPQDSVLKRHFFSQMRADIMAGMAPRPSDSILQRHYEALIQCELDKRLLG